MLLTGSLALNILFYYPINLKKLSHQINLTYGILKHSKFGSFTNFQRLNRHWSVLVQDSTSTWQGGDKRKRRWREGQGGGLFKGGNQFKYFHQRGVIIQERCLIEESTWLLFEECMGYVISRQGNWRARKLFWFYSSFYFLWISWRSCLW